MLPSYSHHWVFSAELKLQHNSSSSHHTIPFLTTATTSTIIIILVIIAHYSISWILLYFFHKQLKITATCSLQFHKAPRRSSVSEIITAAPASVSNNTSNFLCVWTWDPHLQDSLMPHGESPISLLSADVFFSPSLDYTSSLPANCRPLSETFLLILISFTITIFHVCGVLCLAGKGKDNYCGVSGINPTRCHLMACLPQWLMNRLLVSNHLHPLLFHMARSVPVNQFAQLWQLWAT